MKKLLFIFLLSIFSFSAFSSSLNPPTEPVTHIKIMLMAQTDDSHQTIELNFKSLDDLKSIDVTSFDYIFEKDAIVNIAIKAVNENVRTELSVQNVAHDDISLKLSSLINTVEKILSERK